jgi:hypothetical protein
MRLILAACVTMALSATPATAVEPGEALPDKEQLSVLVQAIRANRRALVSVNLGLSQAESEKFWPLYDEYVNQLAPIGDRMAALIEEYIGSYRTLSNEKALQLIKDYGAADAERLQVRRSYIDRFAEILPGRTVARFYQIENKMDAVVRYDLAATIPVIDEKAQPPAK